MRLYCSSELICAPGTPKKENVPPKFEGDKLAKPAFLTLSFNGLIVQHRVELLGSTSREPIAAYTPHPPELPLTLQGHAGPARFRNIWVRRLRGYDA